MTSAEVFMLFALAINHHDVQALSTLMPADHVFVDARGQRVQGVEPMKAGWSSYFAMCPDYWIRPDNVMADGGVVLAAGEAGGTIDGTLWHTPAAWKVVIVDGKVMEWHVFADNTPVLDILAKRR